MNVWLLLEELLPTINVHRLLCQTNNREKSLQTVHLALTFSWSSSCFVYAKAGLVPAISEMRSRLQHHISTSGTMISKCGTTEDRNISFVGRLRYFPYVYKKNVSTEIHIEVVNTVHNKPEQCSCHVVRGYVFCHLSR